MQKLTKPKPKKPKNYHPQKENPTKQRNNNAESFIFPLMKRPWFKGTLPSVWD